MVIVIIVAWLPIATLSWVATTFQPALPDAAGAVTVILAGLFSLEVASCIGPKPFESPLHQIIGKFSAFRDKVVMVLLLILGLVVIYLPRTTGMDFSWFNIVFRLAGLLVIYAFGYVFGTEELRREMLLKRKPKDWSPDQEGNL